MSVGRSARPTTSGTLTSMDETPDLAPQALPAVLLIDDLRVFRQDLPHLVARTSQQGLEALRVGRRTQHTWRQIWLDHDLGDATGTCDVIGPVIDWMCHQALSGTPVAVEQILIHTTNVAGGAGMVRALERVGYRTTRVPAKDYLLVDEALYNAAVGDYGPTYP